MNYQEHPDQATQTSISIGRRISRWAPLALMLGAAWLLPKISQAVQPHVAAAANKTKTRASRAWHVAREKAEGAADQVTANQNSQSRIRSDRVAREQEEP